MTQQIAFKDFIPEVDHGNIEKYNDFYHQNSSETYRDKEQNEMREKLNSAKKTMRWIQGTLTLAVGVLLLSLDLRVVSVAKNSGIIKVVEYSLLGFEVQGFLYQVSEGDRLSIW